MSGCGLVKPSFSLSKKVIGTGYDHSIVTVGIGHDHSGYRP